MHPEWPEEIYGKLVTSKTVPGNKIYSTTNPIDNKLWFRKIFTDHPGRCGVITDIEVPEGY